MVALVMVADVVVWLHLQGKSHECFVMRRGPARGVPGNLEKKREEHDIRRDVNKGEKHLCDLLGSVA